MKFAELKTALKTKVAPAYCLFGADVYLINKAIDLIREAAVAHVSDAAAGMSGAAAAAAGAADLNISRLDDTASTSDIIAACRTVSFFGGRRVVIVKPCVQDIAQYLKNPDKDCVLILVAEKELRGAEPIDCSPMTPDLLIKLIANQLAGHNKKITPEAAAHLCNCCGNLYSRIDGELNKLVNFFPEKGALDTGDINAIVTKTASYQIFELSNAVCGGNIVRAEEVLRTLRDQGIEDYAIFGSLVSSLRRVFYSLACKAPNDTVAAVLGCSPYAVNYARRDYRSLAPKIAWLYANALDLEHDIKSGKVLVERAIVLMF